jgi:enoyl-CoA hydratase
MSYEDFSFFEVDVEDGIGVVRFGTTDATDGMITERGFGELPLLLPALQQDASVRAVLVTGRGERFCRGASAEFRAAVASDAEARIRSLRAVRNTVWSCLNCDKPVVSAINGTARGLALTFALLADIVVVERHVVFSDSHVRGATHPGDGGVLVWPAAMGTLRAKRYLLTGDPVSAEQAERLGLVTEVVDKGESIQRAREFATRLAAGSEVILRETKQVLNRYLTSAATQVYDASWGLEALSLGSRESAAAIEDLVAGGPGGLPADPQGNTELRTASLPASGG